MRSVLVAAAFGLSFAGCAPVPPAPPDLTGVPPALAEVGLLGLTHPAPDLYPGGLYTSGQPSKAQFEQLAIGGVRRVVHLRPHNQPGTGWEEEAAPAARIDFVRLPIHGVRGLLTENVRAFAAALAASRGQPTLVCGASSDMAGAMLALKHYWIDGGDAGEALALGRRAGLLAMEAPVLELLAAEPPPGFGGAP